MVVSMVPPKKLQMSDVLTTTTTASDFTTTTTDDLPTLLSILTATSSDYPAMVSTTTNDASLGPIQEKLQKSNFRSKEQSIKCQFCPKTFSAMRWNTGKKY